MRAVVQRVSRAAVREVATGEVLGCLGGGLGDTPGPGSDGSRPGGLCVLLGIGQGDTPAEADWLADKIAGLRIFADADVAPAAGPGATTAASAGERELALKQKGNMNRSLREVGGGLLVISQFTLYADTSRGRRPSFTGAMPPAEAQALYEYFVAALRRMGYRVETGRFGALMAVELVNEGPVTIWLDSREAAKGRDRPPEPANERGAP